MKKALLTIVLLLSLLSTAQALDIQSAPGRPTIWSGGTGSTILANGATNYFSVIGLTPPNATEELAQNAVTAIPGTLSNLYCLANGSPGVGKSYVITLRGFGSDQALTCTISDASNTCSDNTNTVSTINTVGRWVYKSVPSGTPTQLAISCSLKFTPN